MVHHSRIEPATRWLRGNGREKTRATLSVVESSRRGGGVKILMFEKLAQLVRVSDAWAAVRNVGGLAQTALNSVMARMYWARSKTPGLGQFFWLREPCISRMEGYS